MHLPEIFTKKNTFTRLCIGDAIISLLKNDTLNNLKISAVVLKAGVSRMTFYKYYPSLQAALSDYLQIVVAEYVSQCEQSNDLHAFLSYEHILEAFHFFDRYRTFFLVMKQQGLYHLLMDSVNSFLEKHVPVTGEFSIYKLYSYAGSLLNCFLMWEENGRKERAEDVAGMVYQLFGAMA